MEYPEYLKLSDMRSPVAEPDAVYVAPVKRKLEKQKQQAEIRAIPANKRPLEWQLQTAGENYDALHNKAKEAWDEYIISPEDVADARNYYENELAYEDFPGAIPLAALGSTLSGEAYDFWRELQTDPANLAGGEIIRAGDKVGDALGAIKLNKRGKILTLGSQPLAYADELADVPLYHGSTADFKQFRSGADPDMLESASKTGYGGQSLGGGVYTDDDQIHNLLGNLNPILGKTGATSGYQYTAMPNLRILGGQKILNTASKAEYFLRSSPDAARMWMMADKPALYRDMTMDLSNADPAMIAQLAEKYADQPPIPLTTAEFIDKYRNAINQKLGDNKSLTNRFLQSELQRQGIGGAVRPSPFIKDANEIVLYNPNALDIVDQQVVDQEELKELLETIRRKK